MSKRVSDAVSEEDSGDVGEFGYQQELERRLGGFQMFAISFAFISVAVGIFGTYGEVLQSGGPFGIWVWIPAAIGQTLVALVMAQFAARMPLSGSSYQWASRLANPKIGWGFGWLSYCFLGIGVVAVDNALASQAFMPLFEIAPDEGTARLLTLAILLVQAVLVVLSTRIVAVLNSSAVALELTIVVVLAIALFVAVAVGGDGSLDNLTSRGVADNAPDYFGLTGPFALSIIVGLATLVGFDAAANLAEEAKDPFRTVPRAIVGSVVGAAVLGMVFLIALTVAIPDVAAISNSASPVAEIMRLQLGSVAEKVLLVAITFAFFAAGMVTMATGARLVYAMARDSRFPAHRLMRRVDPRTQTPIPATILMVACGIVLMLVLPGDALLELITAGTVVLLIVYVATVVLYLAVRGRLGRQEGAFSLGRFEVPVAVVALVWLLVAMCVVVLPSEALTSVLVAGGVVALGVLFFVGLLVSNPEVMNSEPGDAKVFEH